MYCHGCKRPIRGGTEAAKRIMQYIANVSGGTVVQPGFSYAQAAGAEDVVDTHGHLATAYGASGPTLILIRPDGYIGVISDAGDASVIEKYLKNF